MRGVPLRTIEIATQTKSLLPSFSICNVWSVSSSKRQYLPDQCTTMCIRGDIRIFVLQDSKRRQRRRGAPLSPQSMPTPKCPRPLWNGNCLWQQQVVVGVEEELGTYTYTSSRPSLLLPPLAYYQVFCVVVRSKATVPVVLHTTIPYTHGGVIKSYGLQTLLGFLEEQEVKRSSKFSGCNTWSLQMRPHVSSDVEEDRSYQYSILQKF